MGRKLPYYLMYPTPELFTHQREMNRDYEYLKSMYPEMAKQILPYVEEECDRYEYDESMIYDEYPDKLQLQLMCRRIHEKAKQNTDWDEQRMCDMVEILLYQELLNRRETKRNKTRRIFW